MVVQGNNKMWSTVKEETRYDYDGKLTLLDNAPVCSSGGHEAEVTDYYVRTYNLDGEKVKVRVGFQCLCGTVTIDGAYEGAGMRV